MQTDDVQLIVAAQKGDPGAFDDLVCRYDKQVLSIALSYCSDEEAAKDVYQEVFLRVYRALPRFQFKSQFSTWLYRIVVNACLTHRAKERNSPFVSVEMASDEDERPLESMVADPTAADETLLNAEISAHIQDAIGTLSPQQRMVFTLRHYDGFKLREIAAMMDCAEGTVKKYLFTATERMRDRLKSVYFAWNED